MTLLFTGPTHHDPIEELLQKIEERANAAVQSVIMHATDVQKHEEHVTSQLAYAISHEFQREPLEVDGLALDVRVDEFNRFQERRVGADLYISLVRQDLDFPISKGMLIQAKRRVSLLREEARRELGNQSKRMYRRSKDASYIWIYERGEVVCTKAPRASHPHLKLITNPMTIGKLIAEGLRCELGDRRIGRDPNLPVAEGILEAMERVTTPRSLDFAVRETRPTLRMHLQDG